MPARLKITLTQEEDKTLKELELANQVARRIKQRASILRLNSRGKTVQEIALYAGCASSTVRDKQGRPAQGEETSSSFLPQFIVGKIMDWWVYGRQKEGEQRLDGKKKIRKW